MLRRGIQHRFQLRFQPRIQARAAGGEAKGDTRHSALKPVAGIIRPDRDQSSPASGIFAMDVGADKMPAREANAFKRARMA